MLRTRRRSLTTYLLLAAYLTASTAGGLLHVHAVGERHDAADCCHRASSPGEGCDHEHSAAEGVAIVASSDDSPAHDDDCLVCRFLGERTIGAAAPSAARVCDLVAEVPPDRAVDIALSPARTTHSRAPPADA